MWQKNGGLGDEPKALDWGEKSGQDLLYTVLAHTSGIDYRTIANTSKAIEQFGNDLAQIKEELESKIRTVVDEVGDTKIKSIFDKVFGTDVEKFASDWQEIQAAVGQLEQHQNEGVKVTLPLKTYKL